MQRKELTKENVNVVEEKFYELLGRKDSIVNIFMYIKSFLGYKDNVEFYEDMLSVYDNPDKPLNEIIAKFDDHHAVVDFFNAIDHLFLGVIYGYLVDYNEGDTQMNDELWMHLGNLLKVEKFKIKDFIIYLLLGGSLSETDFLKRDVALIFTKHVTNNVMITFEEALNTVG